MAVNDVASAVKAPRSKKQTDQGPAEHEHADGHGDDDQVHTADRQEHRAAQTCEVFVRGGPGESRQSDGGYTRGDDADDHAVDLAGVVKAEMEPTGRPEANMRSTMVLTWRSMVPAMTGRVRAATRLTSGSPKAKDIRYSRTVCRQIRDLRPCPGHAFRHGLPVFHPGTGSTLYGELPSSNVPANSE